MSALHEEVVPDQLVEVAQLDDDVVEVLFGHLGMLDDGVLVELPVPVLHSETKFPPA